MLYPSSHLLFLSVMTLISRVQTSLWICLLFAWCPHTFPKCCHCLILAECCLTTEASSHWHTVVLFAVLCCKQLSVPAGSSDLGHICSWWMNLTSMTGSITEILASIQSDILRSFLPQVRNAAFHLSLALGTLSLCILVHNHAKHFIELLFFFCWFLLEWWSFFSFCFTFETISKWSVSQAALWRPWCCRCYLRNHVW